MLVSRQRKRLAKKLLLVIVLIWAMLILYMSFSGVVDDRFSERHRPKSHVHGTEGYIRAERLQKLCNMRGHNYNTGYVLVKLKYATNDGSIQLCPISKVGTTFLKRLFMIKTLKQFENITNPYKISFLEEFRGQKEEISKGETAKRFLFVRNPYDRLLSSYVDKLLAPNPVYWSVLGIPAIKYARPNPSEKSLTCGHDLTFKEYVTYVLYALGTAPVAENRRKRRRVGVSHDQHFALLTEVSKPCHIKYDFVGKMETFTADSLELIRQLNLSETERILNLSGSEMAADDAIQDTTYQPFDAYFRSHFLKCITLLEALKRSWRKLQIRGLIGEEELHVNENEAEKMAYAEFLLKARAARRAFTKENRVKLKTRFYNQFYATIPNDMLQNLSSIYKDDYELFDYDDKPSNLFHRMPELKA